jgi:hypothetical protein
LEEVMPRNKLNLPYKDFYKVIRMSKRGRSFREVIVYRGTRHECTGFISNDVLLKDISYLGIYNLKLARDQRA